MKAPVVIGLGVILAAGAAAYFLFGGAGTPPASPEHPGAKPLETGPAPITAGSKEAPPSDARAAAPVASVPFEDRAIPESREFVGLPRVALRGRVVDQEGRPLARVPVRARYGSEGFREGTNSAQATTDEAGRFEFESLPIGARVTLRARPPALRDATIVQTIERRETLDVGDLVALPGASVQGVVMNPDKTPLIGASVRAVLEPKGGSAGPNIMFLPGPGTRQDQRIATTNAQGEFILHGLEAGTYKLSADHGEYVADARAGVMISAQAALRDQNFVLSEGLTVKGVVVDGEGTGVTGATVSVRLEGLDFLNAAGEAILPSVKTNSEGLFELKGVRKGTIKLTAEARGFARSDPIEVKPGELTRIALSNPALVFGRIHYPAGISASPSTVIRAVEVDTPWGLSRALGTLERGAEAAVTSKQPESLDLYCLSALPDGPVRIEIDAPGCSPFRSDPLTLEAGQTVELSPTLEPELVITGKVLDSEGKPVADALVAARPADARESVRVSDNSTGTRRTVRARGASFDGSDAGPPAPQKLAVSDASGHFSLPGLGAGVFTLAASHPRHLSTTSPSITLAKGVAPTPVSLTLGAAGAIAGRAWSRTGAPLAQHPVQINTAAGPGRNGFARPRQITTDREGRFHLGGLEPGRYEVKLGGSISADSPSFAFAFAIDEDSNAPAEPEGLLVEAGKTTEVEVREPVPGVIRGVVYDGGTPVADVTVRLEKKRRGPRGFPGFGTDPAVRTDPNGAFAFDEIEAGQYLVSARAPLSALPIEVEVEIRPGSQESLRVDLPSGAIEGRILDTADQPIAHARITVERLQSEAGEVITESVVMVTASNEGGDGGTVTMGSATGKPILTDAEGRYRIPFLPAAAYELNIQAKGYARTQSGRLEVRDRETLSAPDLKMRPSAQINLTVTGRIDGSGMIVAHLRRADRDEPVDVKTIGKTNSATFDGLDSGDYEIEIHNIEKDTHATQAVSVVAGTPANLSMICP